MSENNSRKLTILYGSQTGNAQDISERIWRESKRLYFTGPVKPMDDYDVKQLIEERCVIFVCSTTGQGDEPDNMKSFWKFLLKRNLPVNSLLKLKFAVLGLGDSSYVKFNFVGKRLNKRLLQLGATMILPLALGDDQHDLGYDAVVDVWIESLWKELLNLYPLHKDKQPLNSNVINPRWKVEPVEENCTTFVNSESMYFNDLVKIPNDQILVQLKENIRTTSTSHFQDVRLLKFSTQGQNYSPGDVLNVLPRNSEQQVNEFYDILQSNGVTIKPETFYKITEIDSDMPVPFCLQHIIQFKTLCEQYFDLNAIPRRHVFSVLAQITSSDLEKEKCIEFTTAEGQNDLYNYCNRPKRNITEVLRDFPHAVENITIEILFEILTPIKSRAFSIASSAIAHENEIHILVAVVKYKTKLSKERLGLCSNWLANLKIGQHIPIFIKKGSFRFPKIKDVPVIMVGPGTGVAPFRSYICEIDKLNMATANNLILFFGCRREHHDFHCKNDFKKFEKDHKLSLFCAFSRDSENKIYVQHKIEENGDIISELIVDRNAYIYVAGNSKNMPQAVREAFVNSVVTHKKLEMEEVEQIFSNLERNCRYQTETWS